MERPRDALTGNRSVGAWVLLSAYRIAGMEIAPTRRRVPSAGRLAAYARFMSELVVGQPALDNG